jgi:hypothetical protein
MKRAFTMLTIIAAAAATSLHARAEEDIEKYATLNQIQTYDYLIKIRDAHPVDNSLTAKRNSVLPDVQYIETNLGAPPYKANELRELLDTLTVLEKYDKRPKYEQITILTEPYLQLKKKNTKTHETYEFGPTVRERLVKEKKLTTQKPPVVVKELKTQSASSIGPLRIRRTTADINTRTDMTATDGPDSKIKDAKGAKLSFTDNRLLDGSGAWSTEGALFLPFIWYSQSQNDPKELNNPSIDSRFGFNPAVSWNHQEQQKPETDDINELKFSSPVYYDTGGGKNGGYWTTILEPYYHTDFDFESSIIGVTSSLAYRGNPFGSGQYGLYLNDWHFFGERSNSGSYKIALKALADYSDTTNTGKYTTRTKDDDWFRLGLDAGFSIGLFREDGTEPDDSRVVFNTSYKFLDALSGKGGYSDLLSIGLTYWVSDYVGLTGEYQKGETPVADEEIDLITVGLEFRY